MSQEISGDLHRYFLNNSGRKMHKWSHYFDIYERHFARFRGKSPKILEIGVAAGGSLEMWQWYFGKGAEIVGVDIKPKCKNYAGPGINIVIGSQADPKTLKKLKAMGPFDIIIDDGGHVNSEVNLCFQHLYPHVTQDGVYLIEDAHCSYWESFEGGLKREGTMIEMAKDLIDEMNAMHIKGLEETDFTHTTSSMSFYDSVIVFERRRQTRPKNFMTFGRDQKPRIED